MKPIKIENSIAQAIQVLGHFSWIGGVVYFLILLNNLSENLGMLLYVAACIINAFFMFGFAYVIEACAIYISNNQEEKRLTWKVEKKEEKTE